MLNALELTGRADTHVVVRRDLAAALHRDAIEPLLAMKSHAMLDGIDIGIVSAFRDLAGQQRIWDRKFRGEYPLYDADGNVRDHAALGEDELVNAIMSWSAVPGASRHHWGSEIDVIDLAALPEGYRLRMVPEEAAPGGVFHALHRWLDSNMARFGFFRPYHTDRGGVHPEPWHLSYAPVSTVALELLTPDVVADAVRASGMLGKEVVLDRLGDIHRRYVANVDAPQFPVLHDLA
ncbi:MAG TPA: M15 family metallopeptidase [Burkholderiales bacterium]|nr:M15 family metallopeptidase [Burkholderiales bacterium]